MPNSLRQWNNNQKLRLFFAPNFEIFSQKATSILLTKLSAILKKQNYAVFVPSSGKTPRLVYEMLRSKYKNSIDWSKIIIIQMDEYWEIPNHSNQSLALDISKTLVGPLGIKKYQHFFDKKGKLILPLAEYEKFITKIGGIDFVLHGLGQNGHIGFNEPGASWASKTRKVKLASSTLQANFHINRSQDLAYYQYGATLGLKILSQAKHAMLLISGSPKSYIVQKIFSTAPSKKIPATSLCLNNEVDILVDSSTINLN